MYLHGDDLLIAAVGGGAFAYVGLKSVKDAQKDGLQCHPVRPDSADTFDLGTAPASGILHQMLVDFPFGWPCHRNM